ncbi:pentatricopeptide repeat-containing protein At5g27110 [Amborella trichopoda]|nr:pentatricopeptide repeat-containing protein At5g27110 [Amborella trichopoda]|eukprot:XP_006857329.3 pentatricopeptide repeat-containing protein At5g27110 [Amborella trichopoda]
MDTQKLAYMLQTLANSRSLNQGKLLHKHIISHGLQNNFFLCKKLIDFYFSCRCFDSARLVFKTLENTFEISMWNGLMASYSKNQLYSETLELFQQLQKLSWPKPDNYTFPSVLKSCAGLKMIKFGENIHGFLIKSGFEHDIVVMSSLMGVYCKSENFIDACQVFNEMPERDVASWNTMLSCYYQDGQCEKALEFFEKMRSAGVKPNSVTFTIAFSACARLLALDRGKDFHESIMNSEIYLDVFLGSAIVDMYAKCGCLGMSRKVFEAMPTKNVVSFNSIISGCAMNGDTDSCMELFIRMEMEGLKPNSTTLTGLLAACTRTSFLQLGKFIHGYVIKNGIDNDVFIGCALIDLYFKCGNIKHAELLFLKMPKNNVVVWNVMVSGYVTRGHYNEALEIFEGMRKSNIQADAVTFSSVLSACSQIASHQKGKEIHHYIIEKELESDLMVGGALIDMYAKCGLVEEAHHVFERLPDRDVVSWTAMIEAYGSNGLANDALKLFERMSQSNVKPDNVTFLSVLSACSHGGLVHEGCGYFKRMEMEYGISPSLEHYSCMIDLLGRAGKLHEAYEIFKSIPMKTDVGLLGAMLSACNIHGNLELGTEIGDLLLEKDPDDASIYIILSNMYAKAGRWEEMGKLRREMRERGVKKNPGCSWIEGDERMHIFFVGDKSHPQYKTIHECLKSLMLQIKKAGYSPNLFSSKTGS